MRALLPWLTAAVIVAFDRITKMAVLDRLAPGSWVEIVPGFALTHVHNPGIAFSLFAGGGPLTRVILHLVIFTSVVIIAAMVVRHAHGSRLAGLAFGLILGGAVGNLIDRVLYGWVIDFVHLWARVGDRTLSWPDFNVADAAISCGAVLLIASELRGGRRGDDVPDAA
ncbi:MAG: signal peptidase II [Thermoanaerobaculales bacterium]|jgi:signal peptidase II|nr:signal peptidase II [Thermoanaerobaculales bacterium]